MKKTHSNLFKSKVKIKSIQLKEITAQYLDSSNVKLSSTDNKKQIKLPKQLTTSLAEEIGIHYGDGFLSSDKNDFRVKGHKIDEKEYYDLFLKQLYKELFNIEINQKDYGDSYGFEIYSQALSSFKKKVLKIKGGKKETIQIPNCIKKGSLDIKAAFLRGIFDTDGNIYFQSKYGYQEYYPIISLEQKSKKLIEEVGKLLRELGFKPKIYINKRNGIYLNGYERFFQFEKVIGFHNPKHIKKIIVWKEKYKVKPQH